jgi:methylated-DNA-[protein]-cysteine S-methyltransferase
MKFITTKHLLGIALIGQMIHLPKYLSVMRCWKKHYDSPVLNEAIKQLDEYFEGERKIFDLPINQPGTDFQQQVWQQLLHIEYGTTITYGQQSQPDEQPAGYTGYCGRQRKNNLWIVVPCHRVIGSNGSLTGYAGGFGANNGY